VGEAYGTYGGKTNAHRIMVGKPEGISPLKKKPMCIWEDNIKMNLKKISRKGLNWICLAQNRD
jgi:hypothetical protein